MVSLGVLAAVHGGQAHAQASPENLAKAKHSVRCAVVNILAANASEDPRVRDVALGGARMMSQHADKLGATKEMKDTWFAEFEQQIKDAYAEDKSAKNKVRDYDFLPRVTEPCQRLYEELLDALVKEVEKAPKKDSTP